MGKQILVVDDEKEIADLVEVYLCGEGYGVLKCYNGNDALQAVKTQKIDLAVLDVMLRFGYLSRLLLHRRGCRGSLDGRRGREDTKYLTGALTGNDEGSKSRCRSARNSL